MRSKTRAADTHNLCLLALQHAFSVIREDSLLISHRNETNTRLLGSFRIASDKVVDLQSIHASHALQQSRRVAAETTAS